MSTWTLAYRNPRANHFRRVTDWAGTWEEAHDTAMRAVRIRPDLQIFYVPTVESEATATSAALLVDAGNILLDHGTRVAMRETGRIGELCAEPGLLPPDDPAAWAHPDSIGTCATRREHGEPDSYAANICDAEAEAYRWAEAAATISDAATAGHHQQAQRAAFDSGLRLADLTPVIAAHRRARIRLARAAYLAALRELEAHEAGDRDPAEAVAGTDPWDLGFLWQQRYDELLAAARSARLELTAAGGERSTA